MTTKDAKELMVYGTVCYIAAACMTALVLGLYDTRVDNRMIFDVIKPILFGLTNALSVYLGSKIGGRGK